MALNHFSKKEMINTFYLIAMVLPWMCFAEEELHFELISRQQFPALVFVQEDINSNPSDRSSLMIATFNDGKASVQKVLTSEYVQAVQLSDTVFLLEADQHPKDRSLWKQTHFLVDFQTGSRVLLSQSQSIDKLVHIQCLRSNPEKNEAVLLRYGQGTEKSTFIHVNLATLETTELYTIPRDDTTLGFHGPNIKISPDFKLVVAMIFQEQNRPAMPGGYYLRVLDLETMETTELDDEIAVELSPVSSVYPGRPPFEWISPQNVLYQHMIIEEAKQDGFRNEGQYVLKCANAGTKNVEEWIRKRLPLTQSGGYMRYDWFTGEIQYDGFTVDVNNRSLVPYYPCYSVEDSNGIEIYFHEKVLGHYSGRPYIQPCVSHSKKHFAYFRRFNNKPFTPTIYAQTHNMKKPAIVAEVPFYTELLTWIEDTSSLRKGPSSECAGGDK